MTLPLSGDISMSEVSTELGNSASASIGLNSPAVRSLANVPSGQIGLNNLYGRSRPYFAIAQSSIFNLDDGRVAFDSEGNCYTLGFGLYSGTYFSTVLVKMTPSGVIAWQINIGFSDKSASLVDLVVDSSDDIYVLLAANAASTVAAVLLVKVDPGGGIIWQKFYEQASRVTFPAALCFDSSGNIYITGSAGTATGGIYDVLILKVNSSGSILAQKTLTGGVSQFGRAIFVDPSGFVYVSGAVEISSRLHLIVVKLDTSLNVVWQRYTGQAGINITAKGVAVNSSGDVYAIADRQNLSTSNVSWMTVRFDSFGNFQWSRLYNEASGSLMAARGIALDSSGNIYGTGTSYNSVAAAKRHTIVKYNASGSLTNQYYIYNSSGVNTDGGGISIKGGSSMYLNGLVNGPSFSYLGLSIIRLPTDGSVATGTYGSWQYTSAAAADTAGPDPVNTLTLVGGTITYFVSDTTVAITNTNLVPAITFPF